jgi:hypothetical protein
MVEIKGENIQLTNETVFSLMGMMVKKACDFQPLRNP